MKKITFGIGIIILSLVVFFTTHLTYLYFHQQFKAEDFKHEFIFQNSGSCLLLPSDSLKKEVADILNQPFSYVGHGHQMTAFESADHHYVIKFFNPRPALNEETFHSLKGMKHLCSLKWLSDAYLKRGLLMKKLLSSYQLAFQELKEETGLVYIHCDNTTCLSKTIHLLDRKGEPSWIELDPVPFILQKKAEIAADRLHYLIQRHEIDKVKKALSDIYRFFEARARKGITDRQQTLYNNYGFVGDRVVQIDVGRIRKDENIQKEPDKEIKRVFGHINKFLSSRYPELSPFFLETAPSNNS